MIDIAATRHIVGLLANIIRWNEWKTKIPLFLVCMYYAALSSRPLQTVVISEIAGLLLILCLNAAFGYVSNSYSDRDADCAAGKHNKLGELSASIGVSFIAAIIMVSIAVALLLYGNRAEVLFLIFSSYALAAAYSFSPIRLKERGLIGLLAAAIAQRTLPTVLVFVAMEYWDLTAVLLCLLSTLIGLRAIAVHQIVDVEADHIAAVRTVGTTKGTAFLRYAIRNLIFPVEILTLVAANVLMGRSYSAVIVVTGVYLAWFFSKYRWLSEHRELPLYSSYSIIRDYYNFYWPVTLSVLLASENTAFLAVVAFTVLWSNQILRQELRHARRLGTMLLTRASGRARSS